jgi:hypothetical protein
MAYSERRGPNVSEYVANLNAIPSAQDLQSSNADNYNLDDELAMFTNTQFFDFDAGQEADLHLGGFGSEGPARAAAPESKEMTPLDFLQGACDSDIRGLGVYSCCLSCAVCACVCGSAVVVCLFLDYHCYRWWCALSHMHLLYTGRDITLSSRTIPSPPSPTASAASPSKSGTLQMSVFDAAAENPPRSSGSILLHVLFLLALLLVCRHGDISRDTLPTLSSFRPPPQSHIFGFWSRSRCVN